MAPNEPLDSTSIQSLEPSKESLRICCYGSSSPHTQERYTTDAYNLGQILCNRGHICVNGAGAFGCMGALNKGVEESNGTGKVVGVIHKMFVKETKEGNRNSWLEGCAPVFSNSENAEIYVAGGDDLQERKRMLMKDADALIVLPGGPGTFDEVWEMACSRQIGIINIPIVCVNIDGYYDPFKAILERAHDDHFLYKHPKEILHFEPDSQSALEWIENYITNKKKENQQKCKEKKIVRRQSTLKRMMSVFNVPINPSLLQDDIDEDDRSLSWINSDTLSYIVLFSAGVAVGMISSTTNNKR